MKKVLICFGAGCLGALANSLVVWLFGEWGIAQWMSVAITPALTPSWLYPRIVWGGIWGLVFVILTLDKKWVQKGGLISLLPTAVQLFFVFPFQAQKGMAGLELGLLTPALVILYNWVWGVTAATAIKFAK
jgi:hypothetical protein